MARRAPARDAVGTTAARPPRRLRVDAERNRDAVLRAARELFAERGLEAPLEEVAARAGVGIATLYRRFPTREQLVAAALLDRVALYGELAERALETDDPWEGFASFVEQVCALQADDRGLSDLLSIALPANEEIERLRLLANDRVIALIERAKAGAKLREDFVREDLLLLLIAQAAVVHVTRHDAPDAWRRFVSLMLQSFHSDAESPLPNPPSTDEMTRAMTRLARERGCGSE